MSTWPEYSATPLRQLPGIAGHLGVNELLYKDESSRLGLGSFKALGGPYAAGRELCRQIAARHGVDATIADLRSGRFAELVSGFTLCCATDGNHGKAVAFGSKRFGCRAVVFTHEKVPEPRIAALQALGADVRKVRGTYDDSVRVAQRAARDEGWLLISDTTDEEFSDVAADVVQGYGCMALELIEQFGPRAPTHVFLQAGVGSLAAGITGTFAEHFGEARPFAAVVEPTHSACLLASAKAGGPTHIDGDLETAMEMLSCGEPSVPSWTVVARRADAFLAVSDATAIEATALLRSGAHGDSPIDVGVSGAAGLAGLMAALRDPDARSPLQLDRSARVLVIGTEGQIHEG